MPLYASTFDVHPKNVEAVKIGSASFSARPTRSRYLSPRLAPTSYAACAGSGAEGGSPRDADGVFFINSQTRIARITDGASKTALFSESTLGNQQNGIHDVQTEYKFSFPRRSPKSSAMEPCNGTSTIRAVRLGQWRVPPRAV